MAAAPFGQSLTECCLFFGFPSTVSSRYTRVVLASKLANLLVTFLFARLHVSFPENNANNMPYSLHPSIIC